jgi:uncharacterized membrane protein
LILKVAVVAKNLTHLELTMEIVEQKKNIPEAKGGKAQISDVERWTSLIGGSAMVLLGLKDRSLRGVLLALGGSGLAYHGVVGDRGFQDIVQEITGLTSAVKVERTISINRSPEDLYNYWRNLENLPKFMKHLQSVKVLSPKLSHWIAKAPLGSRVEWDAEIVKDEENHLIAWASVQGADVDNSGFVRFRPGLHGTEVKVVMEYDLPGGVISTAIAKLFGEEPEQQIGDELHRFRQLMETGEIATNEGQSSGQN